MLAGDLLHRAGLLVHHALAGAVELEEQRRRLGVARLREAIDDGELRVVDDLHARDGDAELNRLDHGVGRALHRRERAHRGGHGFGPAEQAQRHLGDDAERAFGADEQPGQVVAGRGLPRAAAGVDHTTVRQHHGQPQHVLAHRPVADGGGARGAGGGHAADGGVGAGVDGEHQAGVLQACFQRLPGDAGFHGDVEVVLADAQDARHAGEVDADAAADGVDVTFHRAAHAEGNHRHAVLGAGGDHGRHFVSGQGEDHRVGPGGRVPRLGVTVMFAHGVGRGDSVAEQ